MKDDEIWTWAHCPASAFVSTYKDGLVVLSESTGSVAMAIWILLLLLASPMKTLISMRGLDDHARCRVQHKHKLSMNEKRNRFSSVSCPVVRSFLVTAQPLMPLWR